MDAKDKTGHTPLWYAIVKNHIETAIFLHRHECIKRQPALSMLPPEPTIVDRYRWKSELAERASGTKSENITVTKVMKDGKHYLEAREGTIGFIGKKLLLDVPGCRNIRIRIDPRIGETNYAGLTFKTPCSLDILQDFTLIAHEEGVVATDAHNRYWISHPTVVDGKKVNAFFEHTEIRCQAPNLTSVRSLGRIRACLDQQDMPRVE